MLFVLLLLLVLILLLLFRVLEEDWFPLDELVDELKVLLVLVGFKA